MKNSLILLFMCFSTYLFGQAKSIRFQPNAYYNDFSPNNPVALKVHEGDTIYSESVDAGGFDKNSKQIAKRGNPVTGPFFIEGAMPGDVLAITLTSVSLDRGYATTVGGFVKRSLPIEAMKEVYGRNAKLVRWKLNIQDNNATPEIPGENLAGLKVPLHPFMGCLGLAAPTNSKPPLTYFADVYGGNMDFYKVTAGATIYLPVFHEGGLLYIGDGHAAQGDGEINGDALETSMSFSFTTKLIKGQPKIRFPRLEDAEHIISMGMDKSFDLAMKYATQGLLEWLQNDYKLTLAEASQVMGPLIEYRIPTLAGPKMEVAAMLRKEYLIGLKKRTQE